MNNIEHTKTNMACNVDEDEFVLEPSNSACDTPGAVHLPLVQEKKTRASSAQNTSRGASKAIVTKPKRARTAYNIFFKVQQEKLKTAQRNGETVVKSAAAISEHWKSLTESQRMLYFQLAMDDKFRYYKAKNAYAKVRDEQRKDEHAHEGVIGKRSNLARQEEIHITVHGSTITVPDGRGLPVGTPQDLEDSVPPYSRQSIALLASKLDEASIDFIIKVLK